MTTSKRLALAIVLLCATLGLGQTTTVTLNVTDADGQAWANGTYEFDIYSPPGVPSGNYNVGGVPLSPTTITGFLDASGNASVVVTSNNVIIPTGTEWNIQVCPQATSQCFTQAVSITGASQSVNLVPLGIRVGPLGRITAYSDTEIVAPFVGNCYYNLSVLATKCYNGTAWVTGGSGGGTPSGSFNTLQFNNAGNFGGVTDWTSNGTTTINGIAGSIFDMHLGTSFFLPGSLASGVLSVTTLTGAVGSIANPTTPNGVTQFLGCNPSSGSCTGQFVLDSYPPNLQTGNYTELAPDRGTWIITSDSANDTYTAPDPTAAGFTNNFGDVICNDGSGTITENRSGTSQFSIGGVLNTSFINPPSWCAFKNSDNTNYYVHRFPDFTAFPDTGVGSLGFTQASGLFAVVPTVQYDSLFTGGSIPVASGLPNTTTNHLTNGYSVQGTGTSLMAAGNVTANAPSGCTDSSGAFTTTCPGGGQTNYPIAYPLPVHIFGLSETSATTVANTITSTSLIGTFEGTKTLNAGSMLPSTFGIKTVHVYAGGSLASVSAPSITFTYLIGVVSAATFSMSSLPASGNWTLDFYTTVLSLTSARITGCLTIVSGTTPTENCQTGTVNSLDFTSNQNLDLQVTWSVASASNTITANMLTMFPIHSL